MKTSTRLASSIGLLVAGVLGLSKFADAGKIDAISGASFKLLGGSTTSSSATLNVYHSKENGSIRVYWDTKTQTTTSGFPAGNSVNADLPNDIAAGGTATITKLVANTSYFFWIQGYEGESQTKIVAKAKITGTFLTDGLASISKISSQPIPQAARPVDALGRRLPQGRNFAPVSLSPTGAQIQIAP